MNKYVLAALLWRYDPDAIRLALDLIDCKHDRSVAGDLFCSRCGCSIRGVSRMADGTILPDPTRITHGGPHS